MQLIKIMKKNILVFSIACLLTCNVYPMSIINSVGNGLSAVSGKLCKARYIIPAAIVGLIASYLFYSCFTRESEGERLQRACQEGDLDTVKSMLEDFNIFSMTSMERASFDTNRERNCPPIHFACKYGNLDILKWMVEMQGADVNHVYTKEDLDAVGRSTFSYIIGVVGRVTRTALHTACISGKIDLVEYLLEKGADPNIRDSDGNYALYYAYINNNPGISELLIARGANLFTPPFWFTPEPRVKQLFDTKVEKKKELEESVEKFKEVMGSAGQARIDAKQDIKRFLLDKDVPASAKKKVIPEIFELRKNHADLVSENDLIRCLEHVPFDKKFFEDDKFKDALAFATAKKLADVNGKKIVTKRKGG